MQICFLCSKFLLVMMMCVLLTDCSHQSSSPIDELFLEKNLVPVEKSKTAIPKLSSGEIGFIIYSINDEKIIDHINSDKLFMTASTAKLMTAYMALSVLGSDYQFKTKLYYTGKISRKGILKGDIYLVGGGDPLLMSEDLISLAQQIKDRGIKEIRGNFYYDETLYPILPIIDPLQDDTKSYNSSLSALSSHFNQLELSWGILPDGEIESMTYPTNTPIPLMINEKEGQQKVLTYDSDHWLLAKGALKKENKSHKNNKNKGWGRIPDKTPGFTTASRFHFFANNLGISLTLPNGRKTPSFARLLGEIEGIPLWEVVAKNLEFSNNLLSELILLKAVAKWKKKTPIDLQDAAHSLQQWYRYKKINFTEKEWILANGSGLSQNNLIKPQTMLKLLLLMEKGRFAKRPFWSLFPVSGYKGTLHKRLQDQDTLFKVWAKTGSMDFSVAITGHLFANSGKEYLFSLYAIDRDGRSRLKESFETKNSQAQLMIENQSRDWNKEAQRAFDTILLFWTRSF